jgi:hypothetical protein
MERAKVSAITPRLHYNQQLAAFSKAQWCLIVLAPVRAVILMGGGEQLAGILKPGRGIAAAGN